MDPFIFIQNILAFMYYTYKTSVDERTVKKDKIDICTLYIYSMSKKGPVAVTNWLICLFQLVLDLYAQEEQSLIAGLGSRIIF